MYFCRLCYSEIKDMGEVSYCTQCRMPFHLTCIEDHVRKHAYCPQCKVRMEMSSVARGQPPSRGARREELSERSVSVAHTRRLPPVQPTRRIDLSERKRKTRFLPIAVGILLVLILGGGGYLAVTKLPKILQSVEQQNPISPFSSTGTPQTTETPTGQSLAPLTTAPGQPTWFSWYSDYLSEWVQGKSFQYSQEIYYASRTVKSDIRWKMTTIVTLGQEKATLTEVSMTTPITETTNFESSARRWIGVESKKCIKVETSTAGKKKEGNCAQSLFGAGVDFEAIPSWESSAKLAGQEEVTVPAGIFSARKVQLDTTLDGNPVNVTLWYVEGKPPIKIEVFKDGKLYMLYSLVSFS